jgi:hypothetical protein
MKLRTATLAALLFLWATPAFSQGCAMCYTGAAGSSKEGQKAISKGVMVLLIPPVGIMTLGVWMAFRYGKKRDLDQNESFGDSESFEIADVQLSNSMRWRESLRGTRNLPANLS